MPHTSNAKDYSLSFIEVTPSIAAKKSIIWLHGLGADGNDFVPIVPQLHLPATLGVRFIFPHAPIMPVTINAGYQMRAWYDIASPALEIDIDHEGIARSVTALTQLIKQQEAQGIAPENVMLAGFSQGAAIVLSMGIFYPERLGGLIALSGYLPLSTEKQQAMQQNNENLAAKQTPIFIAHGMDDRIVPYMLGRAAYLALQANGYSATWHDYPMGHSVCEQEIEAIGKWICEVW